MIVCGPCIEWLGCRNAKGYGYRKIGGRSGRIWLAHRYAWKLAHGDPGDLCVLHACDNRGCVNVDHLFVGTRADNNKDMTAKGRHGRPESRKTHCPQGHPYDFVDSAGARRCRRCAAAAQRRYREKVS